MMHISCYSIHHFEFFITVPELQFNNTMTILLCHCALCQKQCSHLSLQLCTSLAVACIGICLKHIKILTGKVKGKGKGFSILDAVGCVSWLRGPAVEHWSLADVFSLSCARLVADG